MMQSYLSFLMLDRGIELLFDRLEGLFIRSGCERVRLSSLVGRFVPCIWVFDGSWRRYEWVYFTESTVFTHHVLLSHSTKRIYFDDGTILREICIPSISHECDMDVYLTDSNDPPWGML